MAALTPQQAAAVLADARSEALYHGGPHSCAMVNSICRRLADVFEHDDPAFSREDFYAAASYRGGLPEGIPA